MSTLTLAFFKIKLPLCKVVYSGVMVWFAHVADGAELKENWSSEEAGVPGVNAFRFSSTYYS